VALLQASKLIKIDEQRFGGLVSDTLFVALARGNQYIVAYRGFEIGDPAIDKRISAWLDGQINAEEKSSRLFARQLWAKTLLERYRGVPNETQWAKDPIASHLKPAADDSLRDEMFRLTAEALRKRAGSR
jgi:hypothetical protein